MNVRPREFCKRVGVLGRMLHCVTDSRNVNQYRWEGSKMGGAQGLLIQQAQTALEKQGR